MNNYRNSQFSQHKHTTPSFLRLGRQGCAWGAVENRQTRLFRPVTLRFHDWGWGGGEPSSFLSSCKVPRPAAPRRRLLVRSAGAAWPSTPLPHSRLLSSAGTPPASPSRSRDFVQRPPSQKCLHTTQLVLHSQPLGTSTGNDERNKHGQDSVWLVCSWPRGLAPLGWELNTFGRAGAPSLPL